MPNTLLGFSGQGSKYFYVVYLVVGCFCSLNMLYSSKWVEVAASLLPP